MEDNPMREIRIEKVTLNIGCGGDLQKIERAKRLLEILSNQKPTVTLSKKRSTFGIAKGKPVGVKVTLRKNKAKEFFEKVLKAFDNKVTTKQIDDEGNINFGIKEYIDLPGVKYSHEVGMLGLDVAVTLERKGYRVKRRKIKKSKIGKKHKINKIEVIDWLKRNYGVEIVE
ncbi:MAG: 50S ribosomal protein L5 [Candidatus Aenigmatarchaeota archaeon]